MSVTEKISVTARHIEEGEAMCTDRCPIALALSEAHPDALIEVYGGFAVLIADSGQPVSASLPVSADLTAEACDFVVRFDDGYRVEPIEFELTWKTPDEVMAS